MPSSDLLNGAPHALQNAAKNHLWMYFTRHGNFSTHEVPMIVRGEGCYVYDDKNRKIIDGLSGLFTVQIGHGRKELGEAAKEQSDKLAFFPLWSYAHPMAASLAERLAKLAPGDLNKVFFTSGGGEAVESAWKLIKNYYKMIGKPTKHKIISRYLSYHGTSQGALSITGIPFAKIPFEPLVPGGHKVPNTNFYRAPEHLKNDEKEFGKWCADQIEQTIILEGSDSVAAVFLEPVQNSGGCFPPPPGYLERVREICTKYDILFVADETITAFGRIGETFAVNRFGIQPDILICAKGLTSGYAPMGAMIASEKLFEPFSTGTNMFAHGSTFGGHPVAAAVAMKNLDIMENEKINEHVRNNEGLFRRTLEKLYDIPIVGNIRGEGFFYGIELVKNQETKESFSAEESEKILRGFISQALFENGIYCRTDDRGDPVIQLAPALIANQTQFNEIEVIIRKVLSEALKLV